MAAVHLLRRRPLRFRNPPASGRPPALHPHHLPDQPGFTGRHSTEAIYGRSDAGPGLRRSHRGQWGCHRGDGFRTALRRVTRAIEEALTRAAEATEPPIPPLLLETSAGGGDSLGRSPAELGELVSAFPTRLGVCLDSAHLFAGGYSVHTEAGLAELVTELRREALLERVGLVHLNDCKTPLGSYADRHENLWEGLLGRAGLRTFMAQPAFRHVPFVLEVPGFAGHGPDSRNMRRARILRREVSAA